MGHPIVSFFKGFKVGLLPRGNKSHVSFAYKMYKRTDAEGLKLCAGFKQTYCRHVTIEFMGVWFVQLSLFAQFILRVFTSTQFKGYCKQCWCYMESAITFHGFK